MEYINSEFELVNSKDILSLLQQTDHELYNSLNNEIKMLICNKLQALDQEKNSIYKLK